jgi:tRNA A37 methylthiotransferase MiaB
MDPAALCVSAQIPDGDFGRDEGAPENICNYLDMPLQHASDNMLKAMRRNITRAEMEDLLAQIRSTVPGICLRTTLIAGFPGETKTMWRN